MSEANLGVLRFQVTDLIGHPGLSRAVAGELELDLKVGETVLRDVAEVLAHFDSMLEGIIARGNASAVAHYQCARCLIEWDGPVEVEFAELFVKSSNSRLAEDQSQIGHDGFIDLGSIVHDEISLSLPPDPLCKPDCEGLCPTCGADLNVAPCAGHDDLSSSPFAALKQLFGSET